MDKPKLYLVPHPAPEPELDKNVLRFGRLWRRSTSSWQGVRPSNPIAALRAVPRDAEPPTK